MEILFNFKNFEPSEHLKEYAKNKFEKVTKYLRNTDNVQIQINMEVDKYREIVEVILTGDSLHLTAKEETEDMYSSIDLTLDKLVAQLKKIREKSKEKRKGQTQEILPEYMSSEEETSEDKPEIIEVEGKFDPKPITPEEAVIKLEESKDNFIVFHNVENGRVNVIYKRKDGNYGLIDPRI